MPILTYVVIEFIKIYLFYAFNVCIHILGTLCFFLIAFESV